MAYHIAPLSTNIEWFSPTLSACQHLVNNILAGKLATAQYKVIPQVLSKISGGIPGNQTLLLIFFIQQNILNNKTNENGMDKNDETHNLICCCTTFRGNQCNQTFSVALNETCASVKVVWPTPPGQTAPAVSGLMGAFSRLQVSALSILGYYPVGAPMAWD